MKTKIILNILIAGLIAASCNTSNNKADAYGNFETRETIVSANAAGQLLYFPIEAGQILESGTLSAITDTAQASLNLIQLKAKKEAIASNLLSINANIEVLKAQKASLQTEAERARRLLKDEAITRKQMDELEGKLDVMEKQIIAAEVSKNTVLAELKVMDTQLELAKEQLKKCFVYNPLNGTVLEHYAELHEMTAPGKPLYKIADMSIMELRAYVSGEQLPHIKTGQKVVVRIDDKSHKLREMEGIISWISTKSEFTPKVIQTKEERVNLVYAIKVSVKNDGSLKIGMPGEVIL